MRTRGRWLSVAALLLLTACSPARRQHLLELFFDDPPRPRAESVPPQEEIPAEPVVVTPTSARHGHAPYRSGDCDGCHALGGSRSFSSGLPAVSETPTEDAQRRSRLILPAGEICYRCHSDLRVEVLETEGRRMHGPAADGGCAHCHEPHESIHAKLLKLGSPTANLCHYCHVAEEVANSRAHRSLADPSDCVRCHDPHAGRGPGLLRTDTREEVSR